MKGILILCTSFFLACLCVLLVIFVPATSFANSDRLLASPISPIIPSFSSGTMHAQSTANGGGEVY